MDGFLTWLVNGVLPGGLIAGTAWTASSLRARTGARKRWQLTDPGSLQICIAQSGDIDTGEYSKPATGIGQAKALTVIAPSLMRAWRDIDLQRVFFPDQMRGHALETDLILVGGPRNNRLTADALAELATSTSVTQDESGITTEDGHRFSPVLSDQEVREDFGMVIRTANPFYPSKRLIILSGGHTYGVVSAARFAAQASDFQKAPSECAFVLLSTVRGGHTLPPTIAWRSHE